jgi:ABC-type multidrug transport system fused ATPase/permease subunit
MAPNTSEMTEHLNTPDRTLRPGWPLIGVSLLILVVNRVCGLVLPYSNLYFVDRVLVRHESRVLFTIVAVIGTAIMVQSISSYVLNVILARSELEMIARLRIRLRNQLLWLPVRFYDHNSVGSLVSRVMRDVDGIRSLFGAGLLELIGESVSAMVALAVLFYLNSRLTLWILLALFAFLGFLGYTIPRLRESFRTQAAIAGDISGQLSESVSGIRTVKIYRGEPREAATFVQGIDKLLAVGLRGLMYSAKLSVFIAVVLGGVNIGVMYCVGRAILANQMTIGSYVTYVLFIGILSGPVLQIASMASQIGEAMAGLRRAEEVLEEKREIDGVAPRYKLSAVCGHVIFDRVSFEYTPGAPVLKNVSFEASPGTVTAIVGASGAGKSTMMTLLAAFEQPTEGAVCIDGVDLKLLDVSHYRRHLAIVFQDTFLFDGSLRDNVTYGHPFATEEGVRTVCRAALVDEFAESLPQGYATRVGERGFRLSGGQKQRVAIARALLVDPRILILDEATSNLDAEAEAAVQHGLIALMAGRTVFLIAHRLTTIQKADQIIVLENGSITERGRHVELMRRGGKYSCLYGSQVRDTLAVRGIA